MRRVVTRRQWSAGDLLTSEVDFEYWQNKRTGEVIAVKLRGGQPVRYCGPLDQRQWRAPDGRPLTLKLGVMHYGFRFSDDPYNYVVCD